MIQAVHHLAHGAGHERHNREFYSCLSKYFHNINPRKNLPGFEYDYNIDDIFLRRMLYT